MSDILYLPKIPKLECTPEGKIETKKLKAYYKALGRIPNKMYLFASGMDTPCGQEITNSAKDIEDFLRQNNVATKPFTNLKSLEWEMKFQARELMKDLDVYVKQKVVDILVGLASKLGIPNPFKVPIPFIATATLIDENGEPYEYTPVISDLFTKAGREKIKAAMKKDNKKAKEAMGVESTYNGDLGVKSPDLENEELWQRIKNWFSNLINDFIKIVIEAIGKAVKKIPVIGGPIYDAVFSVTDPTVPIEKAVDESIKKTKEEAKKERQKALEQKIESEANKILQNTVDKLLEIKIPFFGPVGDYVDLDVTTKGIVCKEEDLHETEDAAKENIKKSRSIFQGQILQKIYDIIANAPSYILSQFPIVGTIFKALKMVVDIIAGKNPITDCVALRATNPIVFELDILVKAKLPSCVEIIYTE